MAQSIIENTLVTSRQVLQSKFQPGRFNRRVLSIVRNVPTGRVTPYGAVAALAGHPNAWRAVGTILKNCRTICVPCHRVVNSSGRVGNYSDPLVKRELLRSEGVQVTKGRIKNFDQIRWPDLP